jgi:hypothetical protein
MEDYAYSKSMITAGRQARVIKYLKVAGVFSAGCGVGCLLAGPYAGGCLGIAVVLAFCDVLPG